MVCHVVYDCQVHDLSNFTVQSYRRYSRLTGKFQAIFEKVKNVNVFYHLNFLLYTNIIFL